MGKPMSGRIVSFWDEAAGAAAESRVPQAAAGPSRELVDDPPRGALDDAFSPPSTIPSAACDHGAAADWQPHSTHRTSAGTVAYARCRCGAWMVLLDGRPLAATHPR
jgi:hypothetical protein